MSAQTEQGGALGNLASRLDRRVRTNNGIVVFRVTTETEASTFLLDSSDGDDVITTWRYCCGVGTHGGFGFGFSCCGGSVACHSAAVKCCCC